MKPLHPLQEQTDMIYLIFEFMGISPREALQLALVCKDWQQVIRKFPIELNLVYFRDVKGLIDRFDEYLFQRVGGLSLHASDPILNILNFPQGSSLTKLKLASCSKQMAIAFSERTRLTNLTELRIVDSDNFSQEGAIAIVQCESLKKLTVLQLDGHELGVEFAKILSESPYMSNLESLSLNINNLGDESLKYISNSSTLKNVTFLSLERNSIFHQGASYLSNMSQLKHLNLNGNNLTDEGVFNISQMENLTSLQLNGNGITTLGITHLANSPFLTNLQSLTLRYVKIIIKNDSIIGVKKSQFKFDNSYGPEVCEIIAKSSSLRNLTRLDLLDGAITPKGVKLLIESNQKLDYLKNYVRTIEISYYEDKWRGRTVADCDSTLMVKIECKEFDPPIREVFRVAHSSYPFDGIEYEYVL